MRTGAKKQSAWRYWPRVLLIIPFALVAWVPFYNRIDPTLWGIPFFYWYQLAAIIVGAMVVMAVYLLDRRLTLAAEEPVPDAKQGAEIDADDDVGPGGNL